jgi:hypothetical protein
VYGNNVALPHVLILSISHSASFVIDIETKCCAVTEKTFTSLVQLIMSGLATEDDPREIFAVSHIAYLVVRELTQDRMTQPDHLGCKPVPTNNFDAIVRYAANCTF